MNNHLPANDERDERKEAIAWLRGVLTAILEVAPLSSWQGKKSARFLSRMPDWLIENWADALNIEYMSGFKQYPDMVEHVKSDIARNLAQQYLESHDAVPTANILDGLVLSVIKRANHNRLPADEETVRKQVCALALAGCNAEGSEFAESARDILSSEETPNHPIADYHIALESEDKSKLEDLNAALTGGRYGDWVAERISEFKRWLCGGTVLNIRWEVETSPDNEGIYQFLLKGGKRTNES